ncbi:MAG TPA: FtsX-like permease family protein [Anaerolineales bacterium]|nr:FtsX-like permease family protein [Anaerolineales bacterium]
MVFKNLLRRKGRTILSVIGISIGVAAIIGLGAMAQGLEAGYSAMLSGSKADLILSQPNSFDISYSAVDEAIGEELTVMPEVEAVSGMLQGFVDTEGVPFFFVFGYPEDSFILGRFQITAGQSIFSKEVHRTHGKSLLLGASAAETLKKSVGDSIRLGASVYKVTGIFESGDAFEDSGAILTLSEAQTLLGKPRQVSLFYIQLEDPALRERITKRVERLFPDLDFSGTDDFADKQQMSDYLYGYVWVLAGLAIIIGGVGMMNSQLMSVYERTREIGVLRAIGWSSGRVLLLILGESLLVCLTGGLLGLLLGWLSLVAFSSVTSIFGATQELQAGLVVASLVVVLILGLVGGLYPAWRASRLQPAEALRYEGGSGGGNVRRLPVGGMAVQSLWQRTTRTILTVSAIGITVGAIMALEGIIRGFADSMTEMAIGSDVEIMIRQEDIADTSLSAIDERIGDKLAAMPEVQNVSGSVFNFVMLPESSSFLILQGYAPNEYTINRFVIIEGEPLKSNHQILIGRTAAEALHKDVGDTIELAGSRFRVAGIYESGIGWEEMGGIITLRDAQVLAGRPHKVSFYALKLQDPQLAPQLVEKINREMPDVHAALSGEFVDELPDMENTGDLMAGISMLAIIVGGVGVLNTMLMAVYERTREIGVLRALGWRRRAILGLILKEALILGLLGGAAGIGVAYGLALAASSVPMGESFAPVFTIDIFARAIGVALLLGLIGGLYPAYRATRMQPVEALRYE